MYIIETITILGVNVSLYHLSWFLGFLLAIFVGLFLKKFYGFSSSKSIIIVVLDFILGYFFIWGTSWIFGGGQVNGFNFVRIVNFAPAFIFIIAWFTKEKYWKVADYLAPVGAICFGVCHFGCVFKGCCQGYPSHWGIFSNVSNTICYPIQPIEALVYILIGVVLLIMSMKQLQKGRLYFWYMVMFGFSRFILEFFRDNEKLVFGISELAFHALASFIIGVIMLIVWEIIRRRRRVDELV